MKLLVEGDDVEGDDVEADLKDQHGVTPLSFVCRREWAPGGCEAAR